MSVLASGNKPHLDLVQLRSTERVAVEGLEHEVTAASELADPERPTSNELRPPVGQ